MAVKPVPDGYHTVTPYLCCKGAARVIEFLQSAFGATVKDKTMRDDGTVWHADLLIGDSHVMVSDGNEQFPPSTTGMYLYLSDVDAAYDRAVAAGGVSIMPPGDQFYGDRMGGVLDPAGNSWWISTHVEDVSPAEMERRRAAAGR